MDEEIKTGEMTGEIDESITVEEDFTLLEGKAVSITDDSDNKTSEDEAYEEALEIKESLDDIRQQIKDKLLDILEKGRITDADGCEIELLNDQYTEKYNELKDVANTVLPGGKGASTSTTNTSTTDTTEVVKVNIDYDEILKTISEKADWLYIDEDGQVMLNGEVVPKLKVVELEAEKIKADVGEFKNLTTENFTATNAEIENLKANKADIEYLNANYATIENLNATNANVTNLQANKANITDLNASNAEIDNLKANKADITFLEANYATIHQLDATNANVTNLQADTANINNALINKANVVDLNATNANVTNLQATKADITDLNASNANINNLKALVAEIQTLIGGNLTMDNIQSLVLTSDKVTIADALIKNAMIDSVSANKINTGSINTNNVSIQSADGSMMISGTTQQFKDKNGKVRIQIGKDASGNFTFALFSQDGVGVLIDESGIKSGAVPDGLIVNDMVADGANISGSKLDINSVISSINNGTTTIKGTRIQLDEQGQSLQVAFSKLKSKVETIENISIEGDLSSVIEQVTSNTTNITTMQGQISSLISNTTITKVNGEVVQLKDEYNSTKSTVNSHSTKIGSLETNLATANNNISSVSSKQTALEQNLNGFKTTVSNTYTTKADFNGLTIGGTNLYPNSNFKTQPSYTEQAGGSRVTWNSSVDEGTVTTKYNGKVVQLFDSQGTSSNPKDIYLTFSQTVTLQPNTTYTLSFDYYSAGALKSNSSYIYLWKTKGDVSTRQIIALGVTNNSKNRTRLVKTFTTDSEHLIFQFRIGFVDTGACWLAVDGVKLEKGNKATEWSPTPGDIDTSIATVDGKFNNYSTTSQMNSAINQKANEITSTVSETYATKTALNSVDNKFANYSTTSAMNSAINQKGNSILSTVSNTYATKTTVTDLSNNLKNNYSTTSAMNTAINQKSDAILSTVSNTYATKAALNSVDGKFANYSTTSAMNTAINQKSDAILSTVSNTYTTKSDFNNLSIGGTNLVTGTKNFDNGWFYDGFALRDSQYDGTFKGCYINWAGTSGYHDVGKNNSVYLEPNTEYTLSFWARGNGKFWSYLYKSGAVIASGYNSSGASTTSSDGAIVNTLTDNDIFKRYWITWKTVSNLTPGKYNVIPCRVTANLGKCSIIICGVKLEKGNKATAWTPAPQDIDNSISAVDNKFASYSTTTQMNTAINQKANEITSTVSNTYATKTALNDVNGKFTDYSTTAQMNSAIKQKGDSITQSVSNTYATKSSLKTATDNISSLTNRMKSAESKLTKDSLTTTIGNYYTTSTNVNDLITAKGYATTSQVTQTATDLTAKFTSAGGINLIRNSTGIGGTNGWQGNISYSEADSVGKVTGNRRFLYITNKNTTENYAFSPRFALKANTTYTLSCWAYRNNTSTGYDIFVLSSNSKPWTDTSTSFDNAHHLHGGLATSWERIVKTFTTGANEISGYVRIDNNGYTGSGDANVANIHFASLMLNEGSVAHPWTPHPSECYNGITQIDNAGIKVMHDSIDSNSYTHMSPSGFYLKNKGTDIFKVDSNGLYLKGNGEFTGTISASNINGSSINGTTINSDSFIGDMLAIDGAISAKSLQVQDIDNAKYPATLDGNLDLYVNSSSGNDGNEPDDGVRYKTLQGAIDAIPKFLNGKTVYITMETNSTEDVYLRGIVGGAVRIYMNGKTLYGTLRTYVCSCSVSVYGGTKDNTEGTVSIIHPSVGLSFGSRAVSVGFEASQYCAIYKVKVFAPDNLPSDITNTDKVCVASQAGTGSVYCKNVEIVNAVVGFRSNNHGSMHVNSSSGVASKYGFQSTTGGIISIANNSQCGGKTSATNKSAGGQVWYDDGKPKFATGNQTTDSGSAPVISTTKTMTIKSSYGDTYRSSVYNSWKKDGTARQGDYGYGECTGCWFFGTAFSELKGKTITKVQITIKRQTGGSSVPVEHKLWMHGHTVRPSGAPKLTSGWSQTFRLATGNSTTVLITNSAVLNAISAGTCRGFALRNTYDSAHYSVCSGSVTVKITYTE